MLGRGGMKRAVRVKEWWIHSWRARSESSV
jgi:hypothetical protein